MEKTYKAPKLVTYGRIADVTAENISGTFLDVDQPAGSIPQLSANDVTNL